MGLYLEPKKLTDILGQRKIGATPLMKYQKVSRAAADHAAEEIATMFEGRKTVEGNWAAGVIREYLQEQKNASH